MSGRSLSDDFLDAYFRFHPVQATVRGYPGLDGAVASFDAEAVSTWRAAVARFRQAIEDVAPPPEGTDAHVDFRTLRDELDMALFHIDDLRWPECNPLLYVETALDGVHGLDFRQDLTEAERTRFQIQRLDGVEPLMRQLETGLIAPDEPFIEAALEMLEGGIAELADRFVEAPDAPRDLKAAADGARRSLDRALGFLERRRAQARPFQAMGEARYHRLLEQEHHLEKPLADLIRLAESTVERVEQALPDVIEAENGLRVATPPAGFGRDDVLGYYRAEVEAMRQAVLERDLVTIPAGQLEVLETPEYQAALLPGASYQPPPAFGPARTGYFFVRPVPERMTPAVRRSYHEQVSRRSFRNLVVHEVYPGHHVQFLHAAEQASGIRKIRDNDLFVEGWALYCEQMMHDEGLFDELPSSRPLRALRMRAIRVVVDIGIHTGRMTLAQAADYMCEHLGAGARGWVETEVRRYAAEPTQALSYLVGRELVFELRGEYRDTVGAKRFSLRDFHDRLLSEGSIPIALIRQKLLAQARSG